MKRAKRFVLPALLLSLCAATATAGVVVEMNTTDLTREQAAPQPVTMSIQGSQARFDHGTDNSVVFLGEKREMLIFDHSRRQVMRMDEETMEQFGRQISAAMEQMQKQMANMPPQVREMMKDKMPQLQEVEMHEVKISKSSVSETQGGHPWVRYDVTSDGVKVRELWVTAWSNVNLKGDDFAVIDEMSRFAEKMVASLGKAMQMGQKFENPMAQWSEIDGFPVLIREFDGDTATSETLFRSVERRDLEGGLFEKPAGYTEEKMEMPRM